MPRVSDTMEEGNIVAWLKNEGDTVKSGDILAEVETDKATMELESYFDGVLLYIGIKEGQVPVDGLIAIIGQKDENIQPILDAEKQSGQAHGATAAETPATTSPTPIEDAPKAPIQSNAPQTVQSDLKTDDRVKASPLAKTIAAEAGVPLTHISGSGDQGRIIRRDVENYIATGPSAPGASTVPVATQTLSNFAYGDVPVSQMRKVIAKRLGESKFTAPHFYLTVEINMDNAVNARSSVNSISDQKISFNDMVVKACAMALRKHPAINSSWMGDKITYHQDINIGVAVAVEDGLLVPVIRHADAKPMSMINQEVKTLATKAKAKKLQPQEMQGNTFTISNLGMFDIEEFTAIINPPDACILAVGSIIKKPIVKDDAIVIGQMMKVTLSCDHRVVDGATGAQFLQTLKAMLENPVMMLV